MSHQALLELLSRHCYHVHSRNVLWLVSLVHHRYLIMNHAVCIINNNLIIHLSRSLFTDLITNKVVIRKFTFGTSVPTCLFHKLYTVQTPTFWYRWFALSQRYSNIRPGWQCSNIWHNETEVAVKIIGSLTSRNFTSSKKKKWNEVFSYRIVSREHQLFRCIRFPWWRCRTATFPCSSYIQQFSVEAHRRLY